MSKSRVQARHNARRKALQGLYQWVLSSSDLADIDNQLLNNEDKRTLDTEYFQELLHKIPAELDVLDQLIAQNIDRDINGLDPVALCILRIGTYELSERIEVPYRVVINEAVELAKLFGAEAGHKYVNGVLDKIATHCRAAERG